MKCLYRITDIPSTNHSPVHQDNKIYLNKLCLNSFLRANAIVVDKIIFLADHCGQGTIDMIKKAVPSQIDIEIQKSNVGINETYIKQMHIAKELDDDVLFQECDYIYHPDAGKILKAAIKELGFVSPYDHPDKYPGKANLRLLNDRHWRSAISTTMTYGVSKEKLQGKFEILVKHGYLDHQMWVELSKSGETLWTPIPSLATHMVKDYLAPGFKWQEYL